jgi:hypothetical protein
MSSAEPVVDTGERFALYEDDGVFGVLDRAVPQLYFAETRERAIAEVARANEIVAFYPTTISMRHLREMDGAWRDARALPRLPEPEGRRLVIDAAFPVVEVGRPPGAPPRTKDASLAIAPRQDPPAGPQLGSAIERTLAAAAEVAALDALRERVEDARAELARTQSLSDEIATLSVAAEGPVAQLRAAFGGLYGEHARAAEEGFRAVLRGDGAQRAVGVVLDDPRALLPEARPRVLPGGVDARERAAAAASRVAAVMARLDRAMDAGRRQAGMSGREGGGNGAAQRAAVQERLRELAPVHARAVRDAREEYRRASASPTPEAALRREWVKLDAGERAAVRSAIPNVEELLQWDLTRGRNTGLNPAPGL